MRHEWCRTNLLVNTSGGSFANLAQCCVPGKRFSSEGPFPDLHRRCESSPLLRRCGPRRLCPTARRGSQGKARCVCGKLRKTIYGSLDAAQRSGEHHVQVLDEGVASPCHFFHKDLEVREYALSLLRGAYELSKVVTLGPGSSQSRTASFLGRTLTLRRWRIEY